MFLLNKGLNTCFIVPFAYISSDVFDGMSFLPSYDALRSR